MQLGFEPGRFRFGKARLFQRDLDVGWNGERLRNPAAAVGPLSQPPDFDLDTMLHYATQPPTSRKNPLRRNTFRVRNGVSEYQP